MKVGLAGTGWRAQMYVRIMKALGEEFEVSAVYVHSESSREREEKNFPGKVYTDYDEFLATKPVLHFHLPRKPWNREFRFCVRHRRQQQ